MAPKPWYASYVGLPYLKGGRSRAGLDCWGLSRLIWREQLGFEAPTFETIHWDNTSEQTRRESITAIVMALNSDIDRYRAIPIGQERPFDGVILRLRGAPMHCGVIAAPFLLLHVEEGCDSCLEDLRSKLWGYRPPHERGRVIGFYRPPGAPGDA